MKNGHYFKWMWKNSLWKNKTNKTIEGDSMLTQATPTHLGECLSYNFSKISPFVRWKKSLIFKLW
jgi:hypothetical protein